MSRTPVYATPGGFGWPAPARSPLNPASYTIRNRAGLLLGTDGRWTDDSTKARKFATEDDAASFAMTAIDGAAARGVKIEAEDGR